MPWPNYIVDPNAGGGEDFVDMASALAGVQADWGVNQDGSTEVTIEFRAGVDNESNTITWDGFSPGSSPTSRIVYKPAAGAKHNGVVDAGYVFRSSRGFGTIINFNLQYQDIDGLQFSATNASVGTIVFIGGGGTGGIFENNIIYWEAAGSRSSPALNIGSGTANNNKILYEGSQQGIRAFNNAVITNNVVIAKNGATSAGLTNTASGVEPIARNNVVCGFSPDIDSVGWLAGSTNNCSNDTSASDAGVGTVTGVNYTTAGVDFVDPQNNDVNPQPSGLLDGAGTSPPVLATDIAGNPRNDPDDAGAFAIVGVGPGVTFDGPDIVSQAGTEEQVFNFNENGEGNVASRFTGATNYALSPNSDPLPSGLSVNATTGNIEGTPAAASAGTYNNIIIRGSDT